MQMIWKRADEWSREMWGKWEKRDGQGRRNEENDSICAKCKENGQKLIFVMQSASLIMHNWENEKRRQKKP